MARSKLEPGANSSKQRPRKQDESAQPAKLYHGPKKLPLAHSLLARAYSPDTAASIHTESLQRRPLYLHATSKDDLSVDARQQRQRAREAKHAAQRRRNRKPAPLSAATKRKLCLYEIPKSQQKWEVFVPLHKLWTGYIRDVLGWSHHDNSHKSNKNNNARAAGAFVPNVDAKVIGPLIASADLHGAHVEVVRSRCVGRVGIAGIVAKDTKSTFEIVTRRNQLKVVPKEYTIFRLQVPLLQQTDNTNNAADGGVVDASIAKAFVAVELLGSQFAHRPAERATKKIKIHLPPDI